MMPTSAKSALRGVVERQARYILIDPYANAFSDNYKVVEEKFEVDSLLYPIWFAADYYRETKDASIFTPTVRKACLNACFTSCTLSSTTTRARTIPTRSWRAAAAAARCATPAWSGRRSGPPTIRCGITTTFR